MNVLIWTIESQQYAVDLASVERIVLAVEITHLPNSPEHILGAINIHGEIVPVINMRKIFQMPAKEIEVQDHFILCYFHQKKVALWVDNVKQIKACDEMTLTQTQHILPQGMSTQYVLKDEDKITLFYNLEHLLPNNTLLAST